ncbi:hypothetical protein [Phaeobacter inhibens]|uniref:hypothetical protein n=1 Tax=Phaeobacter inhibens TaxID=221822 RepID=UPI0020C75E3C|nr:hypothetical protein [Phaeobacter inhibens]
MAIKRALKKLRLVNPIEVVGDGQEALDLLRGVNSAALERPYIILLDLNMPRMGGAGISRRGARGQRAGELGDFCSDNLRCALGYCRCL